MCTFSSKHLLLLRCGSKLNGLSALGNLRDVPSESLKDVLQGQVTVVVEVDVHNCLSICWEETRGYGNTEVFPTRGSDYYHCIHVHEYVNICTTPGKQYMLGQ